MNILNKIIAQKKAEIVNAKSHIDISQLKNTEFFGRKTFSLKESIRNKNGIIAEFKRRSPSKEIINNNVKPLEVVSAYEKFGASGASILTDRNFFGGSFNDILSIRNKINIPVLQKDFIIDEYLLYKAKSIGADIILLIAVCLSPTQTEEFTALAHELKMEVLLEIHTEDELKHFNSKIDLIGINNRNLKNFNVDLHRSIQLKNQLPKGVLSIAESGIYRLEDFNFLKKKGFCGFLMGE